MDVLLIQFVDPRAVDPPSRFDHDLGVLAALLGADGFGVSLLTVGAYQSGRLRQAIIHNRPQVIAAKLPLEALAPARRTLGEVARHYALPAVAFGPFATACPKRAMSFPGVRALAMGEYDRSVPAYLRAVRDGDDTAALAGLWVQEDGELVKGPPAEPVADLDTLPAPDRALFDDAREVARTGRAEFKAARGCSLWCGYCINDLYMDLYEQKVPTVRRRSVGHLLAEMTDVLASTPGVRSVGFFDHAFAMDLAWLGEFAPACKAEIGLPVACHVRLKCVSPEAVRLLAEAGVTEVHTLLPSPSRFIREDIHGTVLSQRQAAVSLAMLKEAGFRVAAEVFIGNPYETEITLADTLAMAAETDVDELYPRAYYPLPGTRSAEVCQENGWVSGRGERHYWMNRTVLDMPSLSAGRIDDTIRRFEQLVHGKSGGLGQWLRRALKRRSATD